MNWERTEVKSNDSETAIWDREKNHRRVLTFSIVIPKMKRRLGSAKNKLEALPTSFATF